MTKKKIPVPARHDRGELLETSVNSNGEWDVCLAGGGDRVADLRECGSIQHQENRAKRLVASNNLLSRLTLNDLEELTNYSNRDEAMRRLGVLIGVVDEDDDG